MKVRASTEAASKDEIDEYDEWYDVWNVQDLMRERMHQKERKKSGARDNASGGNTSRRPSAANSAASGNSRNTPAPAPVGRRTNALRGSALDPQLDHRIKTEPKSRSTTPAVPTFAMDPAALHRQYAPPMQSWPTTPYAHSPITVMTAETSIMGSLYSTPSTESAEAELPRRASARNNRRNPSNSNQSFQVEEEVVFDDGLNEATKLKGVIWEGMAIFDSATAEMKRKRNQKKDDSVLEYLQATSKVVEPTECVFDADGELRRERLITGNPEVEDGRSPLKGESSPEPSSPQPPKKKKAGRKPRQALVEKDVNTARVTSRRGESHHPPFGNQQRRGPYFDGGDEEDDELTYGRSLPRRRHGVSIHRDNSGPDITFDNPPEMSTLTSGFRPPYQPGPVQARGHGMGQNGNVNRTHQRQPSYQYGGGFRPTNNQNPLNAMPPPNFGSFGQLNGMSMLQQGTFNNNNPFSFGGLQAFAAFQAQQHQYGMGQHSFCNDNNSSNPFQTQNQSGVPNNNAWDPFALGPQDMGIPIGPDTGLQANADFTPMNPLFFSSNQGGPEDDEATISPPVSDR
ncbi:hypothetical protein LTR37_016148 [Vermiconidia calcicola]|uniref:Uncharacterized protein n=1 Tax=Vermiconidia calcicola TaxID=1690605 RepID=A0ACC3MPG9_9PEZI|nr:hypothetical protein LTR37_016148 [Vermiconidia calcicola]